MINWGVIPVVTEKPASTDDMFEVAEKAALESGLVQSGDNIVIVAGVPVGSGGTNTMRIRTVKYLNIKAYHIKLYSLCDRAFLCCGHFWGML